MVRPRINQFADDLGVTRSQAVKLINEGRRRRDGGSQTVEKNMGKMKELPKSKKKMLEKYERDKTDNPRTLPLDEADADQLEAMGFANGGMCRGGGKAIQGMKYTGCK